MAAWYQTLTNLHAQHSRACGAGVIHALTARYVPGKLTLCEAFPGIQREANESQPQNNVSFAHAVDWLLTKRVYVVGETLLKELLVASDESVAKDGFILPKDLLEHMPMCSIMIPVPKGLFPGSHVETVQYSRVSKSTFLAASLYTPKAGEGLQQIASAPFDIHDSLKATRDAAFAILAKLHAAGRIDAKYTVIYADILTTAIALIPALLYLCSEEPDISILSEGDCTHRASAPFVERPQGPRYFQAKTPSFFNVGASYERLTNSSQERQGGGGSKSPHIRKAHWHTYLCGKGRTERRLKFVMPTLINADTIIGE